MKRLIIFRALVLMAILLCTKGIMAAEKYFHAIAVAHPPFTLKETTEHGMSWELSKIALETQGYNVSVKFAPWARAFSDTKDGKYDGILIAYWTKEREELFVYPDHPVAFITTGFFKKKKRKDIKYTGNFSDVSSFDIGVERSASMGEEFDKADHLNKIFVNESEQILKMVYLGNIDLGVTGFKYSRSNLNNIAKLSGFEGIINEIEFIQPPFTRRPAYLMISQKTPDFKQKLKDLNAGLEKIRTNGIFKSILKKHGISETEYFPK
ncbi:MAG: transporter substrate-binding domain-containing protein [Desulfobacteraceae bacterium]|nr:transporter substrate-binding domain-containing protein [Desulfobacteraceae bacterium]